MSEPSVPTGDPRISGPLPPNELRVEAAVRQMRDAVETALRGPGDPDSTISDLVSQLSVSPERPAPNLDPDSLNALCGSIDQELLRRLKTQGNSTADIYCSTNSDLHAYLLDVVDGVEILVDPTIGQYVVGYNHVFVGTREQLRDIVVNQTGPNKPYKLEGKQKPYWEGNKVFETYWGSRSRLESSLPADRRLVRRIP